MTGLDTGAFRELALEPLGEGLLPYYKALAERMPLFLYHVPQSTRVDLPLSAVAALALQRRLYPLGDLLGRGGVPLLKQALRHLGLPAGYPRPPYPQESPLFGELLPVLDSLKEEGWIL